jgi:hypothetical protein
MAPVVALTAVVPCAAAVLTATEAGLIVPVGSVSLARTAMVTAWFSGVSAVSATALGGEPVDVPGLIARPVKVATAPARLAGLPLVSVMLAPVGRFTPVMARAGSDLSVLATV